MPGNVREITTSSSELTDRWVGESGEDFAGGSLALTPDVDGDDVHDLLVGAQNYLDGDRPGAVYVVSLPWEGSNSLSNARSRIRGNGAHFGHAVAGGDVDRDGRGDALVGAPEDGGALSPGGLAYLFLLD